MERGLAALDLLLQLGFVVRDADGTLRQSEPLLSTGAEVRSLAVGNFHRQMMQRAAESIELVDRSEREISGLTVGLRARAFSSSRTGSTRCARSCSSSPAASPRRIG